MFRLLSALLLVVGLAACSRPAPPAPVPAARHEHHPPHGGTPVVLGAELYHLELVCDAMTGRLSAYVLDGEMENFIRIAAPRLELTVNIGDQTRPLVLAAVANAATGETVGSTSQFEAQADWLRNSPAFSAELARIEIRGSSFTAVAFKFPEGNDRD